MNYRKPIPALSRQPVPRFDRGPRPLLWHRPARCRQTRVDRIPQDLLSNPNEPNEHDHTITDRGIPENVRRSNSTRSFHKLPPATFRKAKEGTAIVAPGTNTQMSIAKFVNHFAWQGKVFDPAKGELRKHILPASPKAIIAQVYKDKSCSMGRSASCSTIPRPRWSPSGFAMKSARCTRDLPWQSLRGKKTLIHFALEVPGLRKLPPAGPPKVIASSATGELKREPPAAASRHRLVIPQPGQRHFDALLRFERRFDPWVRPAFDAVLRDPLARLTTALINMQRPNEGLKIAEEKPLPDEEEFSTRSSPRFEKQMRKLWKPGGSSAAAIRRRTASSAGSLSCTTISRRSSGTASTRSRRPFAPGCAFPGPVPTSRRTSTMSAS